MSNEIERARRRIHGETKKQRQFMLTDSASKILDEQAKKRGITRSELLEWMLRSEGAYDAAEQYGASLVEPA